MIEVLFIHYPLGVMYALYPQNEDNDFPSLRRNNIIATYVLPPHKIDIEKHITKYLTKRIQNQYCDNLDPPNNNLPYI